MTLEEISRNLTQSTVVNVPALFSVTLDVSKAFPFVSVAQNAGGTSEIEFCRAENEMSKIKANLRKQLWGTNKCRPASLQTSREPLHSSV